MEDTKNENIGEVVSASVLGALEVKLVLDNPEDLRIGYPAIVEGKKYDFYCMVHDIVNEKMDIAERLAGSKLKASVVPVTAMHEGYGGKIFYSKHNIDIFWMAGLGYGHMKHRISNVIDPRTEPDDFMRTDLWPFTSREKVDIYKRSGFIDINLGALIIYHFTPVFSLVFEVNGDFLAPDVAFNIDVSGGLGIAFP